jgi:hypothetical protein
VRANRAVSIAIESLDFPSPAEAFLSYALCDCRAKALNPIGKIVFLTLALCIAHSPSRAAEDFDRDESLSDSETLQYREIPDRGAMLYYEAALKLRDGNNRAALELLGKCLNLHEGFDPSGSPTFQKLLRLSPEFSPRILALHREFPAVGRAQLAFATKERDLVPEGLAYDTRQDVFYLSSLNRRKIVRIAPDGGETDFVPAGRDALLPILGVRTDPSDGSVWANSWSEDTGTSELLHFTATGALLGRYSITDAGKHGFNDLVIQKSGAVILTDSLSNRVYRFDHSARAFSELTFPRQLAEPNGIALSSDDSQLFVADDFGIQRFDLQSGLRSELLPGPHNTLAGVDGLYWHRGSLIGIQNAIGSPRIAAFKLSKDGSRVVRTTVLEFRSALLNGEPTTGAIKGDYFYFIINSQGENMNGDHVADPTQLQAVRIGKLELR